MPENVPDWENELWHIAGHGNGQTCPLFHHCETRFKGGFCPFDYNQVRAISFAQLLSTDQAELTAFEKILQQPARQKVIPGHIFQTVDRLASQYTCHCQSRSASLPISPHLVHKILTHSTTEVRRLPLKAYHGAVWHLPDGAVIYLNANDTRDRQRLTLFHEAFHILLRSKTTPLTQGLLEPGGYFTEMLADFFAGCMVMPQEMVREKWAQLHDVHQLASVFHVTPPAMRIRLEGLCLI